MFSFVGSVLGHAKVLTLAGVAASSVAVAPVAARAFHASSPRGNETESRFDHHSFPGQQREEADHDRSDARHADHDRFGRSDFDRHLSADCRESHYRPLDSGHHGFRPSRG